MNHRTLPGGYRYARTLDFTRSRAQMLALVKLALILTIAPVIVGLIASPVAPGWRLMASRWYMWPGLILALLAYIPLHELTHGLTMLLLSGVPPRYGIRLPYAYAGSTAWFDRKSHIATALAPVLFWGAALMIAIARLPGEWFWPLWILQISNLSGSAGDIYCAWILARMKGDILIQDTGVRMRVMRRQTAEDKNR